MSKNDDKVMPEDVVDVLLDALSPVEPGEERRGRVKKRLFERIREDAGVGRATRYCAAGRCRDWLETGPGDSVKILRTDDESMSMMVRLGPGSTFPRHYHPEDEETYVVEGETWFGDIHLVAGDYHFAPKGTTHGEVRTDTGCVLFIRKATDQ